MTSNWRLQQTQAQRDQKLSELDERADALQAGAQVFESSAAALKRKYWWKNCKMMIMLGVICAIVVIAIAQSICLPIPILFPLGGEMMEENRNGVPIFFGQFSSYFGGTVLMEVQHLKRSRGTRLHAGSLVDTYNCTTGCCTEHRVDEQN
ncbi:hypothetical protein E2320_016802, partial [Naja naja]